MIVADAAFPLKPFMMRPFPGTQLDEIKDVYNYRHCRARRTIENTFGIASARWRILRRPMNLSPEVAVVVVKAICCLHNYMMVRNTAQEGQTAYCGDGFADRESASGDIIPGQWRDVVVEDTGTIPLERLRSSRPSYNAEFVRISIANFFVSEVGNSAAPWQQAYVNKGKINLNV